MVDEKDVIVETWSKSTGMAGSQEALRRSRRQKSSDDQRVRQSLKIVRSDHSNEQTQQQRKSTVTELENAVSIRDEKRSSVQNEDIFI